MITHLKEALSVAIIFYGFYFAPIFSVLIFYFLLVYTNLWPLLLLYTFWMYLDRETCSKNGRRLRLLRESPLWKHARNYFPQGVVKTADLPPTSNYLLAFVPHGIFATSAIANFSNDRSNLGELFPGCFTSVLTLHVNFYVPFFREIALGYGFKSVNKDSILYNLRSKRGGLYCIYPGGSAEAYRTQENVYRTLIHKRKGFVKMALITGTPLVPAIGFGEVSLFKHWIPEKDSLLNRVQESIRRLTGVAPCLILGRGFLQPWFGLLPQRRPVTAVIGKPILVEQMENPSPEDIESVHKKFLKELTQLFEEHKDKYVKSPRDTHLIFDE